MAIKKDYIFTNVYVSSVNSQTIELAETITDAYIVISSVFASKELATITVQFKSDKDIKLTKQYQFEPNMTDKGTNVIKQGYEYLKTLDEFKGATDVLETGQTI